MAPLAHRRRASDYASRMTRCLWLPVSGVAALLVAHEAAHAALLTLIQVEAKDASGLYAPVDFGRKSKVTITSGDLAGVTFTAASALASTGIDTSPHAATV